MDNQVVQQRVGFRAQGEYRFASFQLSCAQVQSKRREREVRDTFHDCIQQSLREF